MSTYSPDQNLRNDLRLRGFQYEMGPVSNQLFRSLAHCFYTEEEDKAYAASCLNHLCQLSSRNNSTSTDTNA